MKINARDARVERQIEVVTIYVEYNTVFIFYETMYLAREITTRTASINFKSTYPLNNRNK